MPSKGWAGETSSASGVEYTFLPAVLDPPGVPNRGVDPFQQ